MLKIYGTHKLYAYFSRQPMLFMILLTTKCNLNSSDTLETKGFLGPWWPLISQCRLPALNSVNSHHALPTTYFLHNQFNNPLRSLGGSMQHCSACLLCWNFALQIILSFILTDTANNGENRSAKKLRLSSWMFSVWLSYGKSAQVFVWLTAPFFSLYCSHLEDVVFLFASILF